MTSTIALFGAFEHHNIRWNGNPDDPWWVGKDICAALKIANHRDALASLDEDERDYVGIPDAIGRNRKTIIINEFGLHRLIFKSQTEQAKKLQRFVFHEVLPSIRKYGCYPPPADDEDDEDDEEWTWESAVLALMLQLGLEFGAELNDLRVLMALGFACQEEDTTNVKIAASLKLDEVEVFRRIDRLRAWGAIDDDRRVLLQTLSIVFSSDSMRSAMSRSSPVGAGGLSFS